MTKPPNPAPRTRAKAKAKAKAVEDWPLFTVDIWNFEGDVLKTYRDRTVDEVDDIREQWEGEMVDVVATEQ